MLILINRTEILANTPVSDVIYSKDVQHREHILMYVSFYTIDYFMEQNR